MEISATGREPSVPRAIAMAACSNATGQKMVWFGPKTVEKFHAANVERIIWK